MKTIIAVRGAADIGKTHAILAVFDKLKAPNSNFQISKAPVFDKKTGDVEVELEHNSGKHVGISSMGDPGYDFKNKLESLAKQPNQCKVILTASRAALDEKRSETDAEIEEIAKNYGYEIIWTSNYRDYVGGRPYHKVWFNELFAPGMAHLIQSIV
jgi:hypothetical protein